MPPAKVSVKCFWWLRVTGKKGHFPEEQSKHLFFQLLLLEHELTVSSAPSSTIKVSSECLSSAGFAIKAWWHNNFHCCAESYPPCTASQTRGRKWLPWAILGQHILGRWVEASVGPQLSAGFTELEMCFASSRWCWQASLPGHHVDLFVVRL